MAVCIECGTHRPDGPGDCPACRADPVLITPEMVFTEARLTAEEAARTGASATAAPHGRLAGAALVVGAVVFSLAVILTLSGGLLRS